MAFSAPHTQFPPSNVVFSPTHSKEEVLDLDSMSESASDFEGITAYFSDGFFDSESASKFDGLRGHLDFALQPAANFEGLQGHLDFALAGRAELAFASLSKAKRGLFTCQTFFFSSMTDKK